MGEKSANNLVAAAADSRGRGLAKLLFGLGIRFLGAKGAELLAARYHTLRAVMEADEESLQETEGIGKVIARSVYDYFRDERNLEIVRKLEAAGVVTEEVKEETAGGAFEGERAVLTGKLSSMGRREAGELIRRLGGEVQSSVTKTTTLHTDPDGRGISETGGSCRRKRRDTGERGGQPFLNPEESPRKEPRIDSAGKTV